MDKPEFDWGREFEEYLESLTIKDRAKLHALISRVENSPLQDSIRKERVKRLDDNLYELRAQTNEHWLRGCYFQIEGNNYYITHGFNKKTRKTPRKEIVKAINIRTKYFLARRDYDEQE